MPTGSFEIKLLLFAHLLTESRKTAFLKTESSLKDAIWNYSKIELEFTKTSAKFAVYLQVQEEQCEREDKGSVPSDMKVGTKLPVSNPMISSLLCFLQVKKTKRSSRLCSWQFLLSTFPPVQSTVLPGDAGGSVANFHPPCRLLLEVLCFAPCPYRQPKATCPAGHPAEMTWFFSY